MNSSTLRGQITMARQLAVLALLTLFLIASTAFPSPAAAASTTVKGEVKCINSEPKGVWVVGEKSKSGWAKVGTGKGAGGHQRMTYEYNLNKGGKYKLHFGCGGDKKNWRVEAKSGWLSGTKNSVKCNDIFPFLQKVPGLPKWLRIDFSEGVKFETCKKV